MVQKVDFNLKFSARALLAFTFLLTGSGLAPFSEDSQGQGIYTVGTLSALQKNLFAGSAAIGQGTLNSDEMAKLNLVEQNLFFKNYDESIELRLARIEKRVFGEAAEGAASGRLAAILQVSKLEKQPTQPRPNAKGQTSINTTKQPTFEDSQQDEQARREDAADQARRRALAAREDEINQMFTDAVNLWKQRKGPEALEKFEQVVRMAPDNAEAHFSLGVIYEAQRNFTQALGSYKRAAEIEPDKREYKEAVSLISKKAAGKDQDDSKKAELRALAEQASGAYKRGEFISALDLYKQIDRKTPNQHLIKYNIATIYLAMKNPVQALDFFRQARKLEPGNQIYQNACAKLEGNLQAEEQQRTAAEQAWANQNGGNQNQNQGQNQNQNQYAGQNQTSGQNQGQSQKQAKQKKQKNNNENGGNNQQFASQQQFVNNQQFGQAQQNQQFGNGQQYGNSQQFQQPNNQNQQFNNNQQFGNNQQFQQPNQQFGNQQFQQPNQPNQQFGNQQFQQPNQPNQQFGNQQNYANNGDNNNSGNNGNQATFMPPPKKQNKNSSGLLSQDKNAPPPSAAFGIIAKSNSTGVRVTTIGIASRAARSGLQRSDVIRAVDGVVIQNENQFQQIMSGKRPGQSIQLLIDRKGSIGQVVL